MILNFLYVAGRRDDTGTRRGRHVQRNFFFQSCLYFFILGFFYFISGCSAYESAKNVDFSIFNDSIRSAVTQQLRWTENPESIARNLFPPITRPEGNPGYLIQTEYVDETHCTIVIKDEGVVDDEVCGEKKVISFEKSENGWLINAMTISLKRNL